MKIKKLLIVVLLVFGVSIFLLGCSKDTEQDSGMSTKNSDLLLSACNYESAITSGVRVLVFKRKRVILEDGIAIDLGISKPDHPVEIPECYIWCVESEYSEELLSEVIKNNIPGLSIIEFDFLTENIIALSKLDHLRFLWFSSHYDFTDVHMERIKYLAKMKQLQILNLPGSFKITDAGFKHISELKQLQVLYLSKSNITDAGLKHIAELRQLQALCLGSNNITDVGLEHIVKLKQLRSLILRNSNITDVGLEHIAKMKQLKKLQLSSGHHNLTRTGVEKIRKLLPGCHIRIEKYI